MKKFAEGGSGFFDLFPKDENRETVMEKPPIKKPCYWQTNFVTKSPETHGDDLFSRLNPRFSGKSFEGCVKITIFAPDYLGLRITL